MALAVPVRDHRGVVVAALSISIPSVRAGRGELLDLVPLAREATARLCERMGYTAEPDLESAEG